MNLPPSEDSRIRELIADDDPPFLRSLELVLEDMHWADIAMLAFVEHVMEWATDLPIFIICTARPELFDRDPAWGGGKRNWSTLSLPPLGEADAGELIAALLPPEAPDELQHLVIERAGGNPLLGRCKSSGGGRQALKVNPEKHPGSLQSRVVYLKADAFVQF